MSPNLVRNHSSNLVRAMIPPYAAASTLWNTPMAARSVPHLVTAGMDRLARRPQESAKDLHRSRSAGGNDHGDRYVASRGGRALAVGRRIDQTELRPAPPRAAGRTALL